MKNGQLQELGVRDERCVLGHGINDMRDLPVYFEAVFPFYTDDAVV